MRVAVGVALWTMAFRPLAVLELQGLARPSVFVELGVLLAIALTLDASLFLVARSRFASNRTVLDFAVLYEVLRCFVMGVSMVRFDVLAGLEPPAITSAHVLLILFPLIVPMRPMKAFASATFAGALQPVCLLLFSPVPVPALIVAHSIIASAVTVAFAVLCGRVGYELSAHAAGGAELGSYRLEQRLGQDSGGELWRASHRLLARPAAVKLFPPRLIRKREAKMALRRFRQEAEIVACLTSPYMVTLYDYETSESGWTYCVMELLDGVRLTKWVEHAGPRSLGQVLTMATQVCDSLAEAHEAGLVHGNLTPDQVYVCRVGLHDDTIKVAGFARMRIDRGSGIATRDDGSEAWPDFVAPEVALGNRESTHSDIFQLGRVIEFLVQRLPASTGVVPAAVRDVIRRCLEGRPSARFRTSRDLLDELRRLSGASALALPSVDTVKSRREPTSGVGATRLDVPARVLTVSENRRQGVIWKSSAAPASAELMSAARRRLSQVGLICAATACVSIASAVVVGPGVGVGWRLSFGVSLFGVLLDLGLVFASRTRRLSTKTVMRIATAYYVARSLVFGFVAMQVYARFGLAAPRLTLAAIFLVLLPAFVPLTLRQLLIPCLLVIAGRLLLIRWMVPAGQTDWILTGIYGVLVALGAMFCAHVMDRLTAAASSGWAFGAYRLTEPIGRGGMGEVWRAEHEFLARPAAIKLIRQGRGASEKEGGTSWERFEKEAYATSLLTSPHTVTLYDYGVAEDGTYYYVMELLEGVTLGALVRQSGPLTAGQTIALGLQVCDSLAEAHAHGLVHRDLKPENLFLTQAGCDPSFLKVLDFGLVDFFRGTHRFEQAVGRRSIVGTPQYMSPEALLGQAMDERSDIYQLGCVLHFLLTGSSPFHGANLAAFAMAHARKPPPRASSESPHFVPEELDDVIGRCLAKEPGERFGSAGELRAALDGALRAVFEAGSKVGPNAVAPGNHHHA